MREDSDLQSNSVQAESHRITSVRLLHIVPSPEADRFYRELAALAVRDGNAHTPCKGVVRCVLKDVGSIPAWD